MARLVYLTRNYKGIGHGGGKARVDVEDILSGMGAVNLGLKRTFHKNKVADFFLTAAGVLKFIATVRRGDVVVLQYPVKKYYRLICRVVRMKGAKTITLIHDLGSFRRRKLTVEEEIKKLSLTDVIIAANQHMIDWLSEKGCRVPMTDQKVWDYLSDSKLTNIPQPINSCLFVGDLNLTRTAIYINCLYHFILTFMAQVVRIIYPKILKTTALLMQMILFQTGKAAGD